MHILHAIDNFNIGGIQDLILNLYTYDRRHMHSVWCYDGSLTPEARQKGMVCWQGGPPPEAEYDVYVGHGVGGWSYDNGFRWAKERGMKTIEVMHSPARSQTSPELCDVFVAVSNIAWQLNTHMPRAMRIYPMVNAELFSVQPTGNSIGRISRLAEEKRPMEFVELARRFPNEKFIIAGDGPLMGQVKAEAPDNLEVVGWVRDFPAFFEKLKLFVFQTKDECACMSVAAAQAAGVPVICQNIPALKETTGGECFIADDFRSAVDDFLLDSRNSDRAWGWQEMARRGRQWALNNFRPSAVVEKWHNLFQTL